MTIWKYPIQDTGVHSIEMPQGANVLTAQMQGETLCLWALVDPRLKRVKRSFEVLGTGEQVAEAHRFYIATVQMPGLVFHVFERL